MGENTGVITGVITLTQPTAVISSASASASSDSSTTTTSTSTTSTSSGCSSMASKDEVDRLIADISNAVQSSSLLSLLRSDVDEANRQLQSQLPFSSSSNKNKRHRHHNHNHNQHHNQHQHQHHNNHQHRKKRNKSPPLSSSSSIYKCLADIPQSTLVDRMRPIRQALERIDAQRLLDLELIPFSSPEQQAVQSPRLKDGVYCRPICDQIRPKLCIDEDDDDDENDIEDDRKSVVRYLHIAEVPDQYTIGIFVFGPHERIPLHDHPEMCVLSRVLYGDLQRLSLDLDRGGAFEEEMATTNNNTASTSTTTTTTAAATTNNGELAVDEMEIEDDNHESLRHFLEKQIQSPEAAASSSSTSSMTSSSSSSWLSRSATWLRSSSSIINNNNNNSETSNNRSHNNNNNHNNTKENLFPKGTKIAYKNVVDVLQAPDVASLYPYEGNLHEFVAGPNGAAVLDVLLPPYDDEHKRDCTFYNIREVSKTATSRWNWSDGGPSSSTLSNNNNTNHNNNNHIALDQSSSVIRSTDSREPCLIVPTGQPENFHCISGRYGDLGEPDIDVDDDSDDDDDDDDDDSDDDDCYNDDGIH